ncbi:MarR family transcriptional regulator [Arcanobacterium hippocoleae]
MGSYAHNLGLSQRDTEAVMLIWRSSRDNKPITPSKLANLLNITRAAATYLVERLTAQGYLERIPDPKDRRRTLLYLSQKSELAAHNFAHPFRLSADSDFAKHSNAELILFIKMLRELTAAVVESVQNNGQAEYAESQPAHPHTSKSAHPHTRTSAHPHTSAKSHPFPAETKLIHFQKPPEHSENTGRG